MALVNLDETPFETLQRSRANINPSLMERPDPGFFQGSSTALFSGIGQAWDVGAVGLSDLATPYIERFGSDGFKEWARKESKKAEYALMDSRVDPSTMGTLAQAFHTIGQIAGSAVVGGAVAGPVGAATAVAGNIGIGKYKEVVGQVDQETAAKMGLTSGLTMGAAVAAPAYLGSKLLTQMLSAAGMNIAFGGAERGITHKILEDEGYAEMAKHYKVLDQTAMTVDAIIGAAIPLGGRGLKAGQAAWDARQANALKISQQVLDDAQTVERGLADQTRDIGLPVTNRAFDAAEQARVDAATQLLVEGRSVADLTLARDALDDTVPNPRIAEEASAMIRSVDESLKTEGEGGVVELDAELTVAARGMAEAEAAIVKPEGTPVAGELPSARAVESVEPKAQTEGLATVKPDEHATVLARDISSRNPEMMTTDAAGNTIPAQKLLDDADAKFKEDSGNASLIQLAIQCAIGQA